MTSTRYIPGTDPLRQMPYSAADTADLIARVRLSMRGDLRHAAMLRWTTGHQPRPAAPPRTTCPGRVGARYAMLASCSLTAAANDLADLGIRTTTRTIASHWRQIYPAAKLRPGHAARRAPLGEFSVGARVVPSPDGLRVFPRLAGRTATVVGLGHRQLWLLIDGCKHRQGWAPRFWTLAK